MDVILISLGVLGLGAIIVSTYVFMVAARNYVSDDSGQHPDNADRTPRPFVERSGRDRRSSQHVTFPLIVNGILIERDRRVNPDRRQASAG